MTKQEFKEVVEAIAEDLMVTIDGNHVFVYLTWNGGMLEPLFSIYLDKPNDVDVHPFSLKNMNIDVYLELLDMVVELSENAQKAYELL